jgi:K+-sensing histidine kinase KdpD
MNRLDRALERFVHDMTLGPPNRPPRQRPEMRVPGERATIPRRTLAITYALAIILPTATAALLIPFRADHAQTTAIVLVVPVVLVAARGATGPALVAAGVAGLAYDVLLTAPYYQLVIDDPDDIVAAMTLVAVAAAVGLLSSRLVHLKARDATREDELGHLVDFLHVAMHAKNPAELEEAANLHIAGVLDPLRVGVEVVDDGG